MTRTYSPAVRIALLAAVMLTAAAWALPADAAEQRCNELGPSCVCSEPLNTTQYTVKNNDWLNPADSPSATECLGEIGGGSAWYRKSHAMPVSETLMPAGNSVNTVWRNTARAGISHIYGDKNIGTAKRVCMRHYFNLSSNYSLAVGSTSSDCAANKAAEFDFFGAQGKLQLGQKGSDGKWGILAAGFQNAAAKNMPRSGTLSTHDCKNQWCILEMCVSGDIKNGSNLSVDGYMRGLNSGEQLTWSRYNLGNTSSGTGGLETVWIANMYRQNNCTGTRSYSHAMQAQWSVDTGQYIGAAYEIESGSSGGTAGPPPTGGGGGSTGGGGGSTGGGGALSPPARPELLP